MLAIHSEKKFQNTEINVFVPKKRRIRMLMYLRPSQALLVKLHLRTFYKWRSF